MNLKDKVYKLIVEFDSHYPGKVPGTGFLAGMCKTSKEAIRLQLIELHKEGKIQRIRTDVNFTDYRLVK